MLFPVYNGTLGSDPTLAINAHVQMHPQILPGLSVLSEPVGAFVHVQGVSMHMQRRKALDFPGSSLGKPYIHTLQMHRGLVKLAHVQIFRKALPGPEPCGIFSHTQGESIVIMVSTM